MKIHRIILYVIAYLLGNFIYLFLLTHKIRCLSISEIRLIGLTSSWRRKLFLYYETFCIWTSCTVFTTFLTYYNVSIRKYLNLRSNTYIQIYKYSRAVIKGIYCIGWQKNKIHFSLEISRSYGQNYTIYYTFIVLVNQICTLQKGEHALC